MSVREAASRLASTVHVDEGQGLVRWSEAGVQRTAGLHDDAALDAVPGLYEAVFVEHLDSGSPALLAAALGDVLPPAERPGRRVLDVGAGTGLVGEHLVAAGFAPVWALDLEPASARAVLRDRPRCHRGARAADLLALGAEDRHWLAEVAPDVVTVSGAVGVGHLPAAAFAVLAGILPPGGLLAVTVAPDLAASPVLADHAVVLLGPSFTERGRRKGVHRRTGAGERLAVSALVLERT